MLIAALMANEQASGGGAISILMIVMLIAIMYFLLFRPQKVKFQEKMKLIDSLDVGDEVVTEAGIIGEVTAIEDDVVYIEVAEGVEMKFAKRAVSGRLSEEATEDEYEDDDDDDEYDDEDYDSAETEENEDN